ncbi:hypothetical protein DY000_02020856 [Brassica cretica]|uniref:Uncharacterized protein n=1 Tax=Brassica cretica TaxID=69181 RepID=A0ABQ7EHN9_BRACR|nr:hypothetical protein DY000_02020856 [Brassica cretica]
MSSLWSSESLPVPISQDPPDIPPSVPLTISRKKSIDYKEKLTYLDSAKAESPRKEKHERRQIDSYLRSSKGDKEISRDYGVIFPGDVRLAGKNMQKEAK